MHKFYYFSTILLSMAFSNHAVAGCASPSTQVTSTSDTTLFDTLSGNTICTSDSQEEHRLGNQLWDYKKGPSDPVDPTAQVGGWSISDTDVTYTYGTNSYTFTLFKNTTTSPTPYTFCNGTTPAVEVTQIVGGTEIGCNFPPTP